MVSARPSLRDSSLKTGRVKRFDAVDLDEDVDVDPAR
jgi:hypothetical protein